MVPLRFMSHSGCLTIIEKIWGSTFLDLVLENSIYLNSGQVFFGLIREPQAINNESFQRFGSVSYQWPWLKEDFLVLLGTFCDPMH